MTHASEQGRRVTKNLIVSTAGQVLAAGLHFAILAVVARYLGVERYGQYAYILAFVGVFELVANAGLGQVLARDIAVEAHGAAARVGIAKSLTWAISLVTFVIVALVAKLGAGTGQMRVATYFAAAGVLATIHANCYGAVFRAFEEMEINAAAFVLEKLAILGLVMVAAWLDLGLVGMCVALFLAELLLCAYYFLVLSRRHFRPRLHFDLKRWWALLAESVPIGLGALLRRISWQVDILILGAFGMTESAGYLSASYRLIQSLNLIPLTLAQVTFPSFSRLARSTTGEFRENVGRSLKLLLFLALPMAVGLSVAAPIIVTKLYGSAFRPAAIPLALMSVSLLFLFPTSLYTFVFTALGVQRLYTMATLASLGAHIVVALALIPRLTHVGASIGALVGEVTLFAVGTVFLNRLDQRVSVVRLAWRPLVASLAMGSLMFALRGASVSLFLSGVLLGLVLYGGLLIALGAISMDEIALVRSALRFRMRPASPSAR